MSEPILLVNTTQIADNELEELEQSAKSSLAFVEANAPRLMVEVYVDGENMRAYGFRLYRDSESITSHYKMPDPYIREVVRHIAVKRPGVCGWLSDARMGGLQPFSNWGSPRWCAGQGHRCPRGHRGARHLGRDTAILRAVPNVESGDPHDHKG